jgi:hypothetical protein
MPLARDVILERTACQTEAIYVVGTGVSGCSSHPSPITCGPLRLPLLQCLTWLPMSLHQVELEGTPDG